jgi:hypothetical protein
MKSVNEFVICEPVAIDKSARTNISSGFARIDQRIKLVKMKVKFEANTSRFSVPAGSTIWVKESYLLAEKVSSNYAQDVEGDFMIIDAHQVMIVEEAK